jgi:hypothetical protein
MTLNLDMNDPAVRQMLSGDESGQASIARPGERKRQMVQLAGDAPDPTGVTSQRGLQMTQRLDMGKQVCAIVYKDQLIEADIYAIPGSPLEVIFICPRCRKQSRITQEMKAIEFNPGSTRPVRLPDGNKVAYGAPHRMPDGHLLTNAGEISIEAFECSWELENDKHTPGIRAGGLTLCRLRLVIDQNVAREA